MILIKQKFYCKQIGVLLVLLFGLTTPLFAQKASSYKNPVQAGDFPDPSVIRVGRDFYATATSSEWSPEFPILHSRDLVNWEIVGNVFPRRPEWSNGNYWAPEIWQENGKFYVFYVGHKVGGNLCIAVATANKPTGPYTDRGALVCQEVGSIDAFPIRDESGKLFVVWKEDSNSVGKPTSIWAQQMDENNFKMIGERREILHNDPETWEGNLVEGPFIMRKGDYFYLFYSANACCGRGCNYAMGVARSKTLLGAWEKSPENPVLKGNENFNCPGHGSAVTLEDGRTFMMYHAYDPKDTNYVGRQALIDEVNWTRDGWATINHGKGPSKGAPSPLKIAERGEEYKFFDDFNTPNLRFGWQWQQNNVPVYRINNGFLELAPNAAQSSNPIGAIMAYWTTVGSYTATTMIDASSIKNGAIAGIAAYGDNENALGFGVQNGKIVVWRRERNNHRALSTTDAPTGNQIYLRLTARDGIFYSFAVSRDGKTFQSVGNEQNGDYLPPWDRGVRVALTVGGAENASARFGFLRIEPTAK
ncbi:MAG: family 43 glycosylhydrolase [Acidobacteriota bacterium]|nr:family 43 glycosylhydrolase [Acidobacteriota bacterium]